MRQVLLHVAGRIYLIKVLPDETESEAHHRLWWIIRRISNPAKQCPFEWNQLESMSKLIFYKKKYHCVYNPECEQMISKYTA